MHACSAFIHIVKISFSGKKIGSWDFSGFASGKILITITIASFKAGLMFS